MPTTTMAISSVCLKCGTIGKSGKMSCCGRSGSWFGNCGRAANSKLDHTWHEGIQACKTWPQSKRAIGQQLNGAQQKDNERSNDAGMVNPKTFGSTSARMSTPMPANTTVNTRANASWTPTLMAVSPDHTSTETSPADYHGFKPIAGTAAAMITMRSSSDDMPTTTSASTATVTQGCEKLVNIAVLISLLNIIVV